MRVEPDYSFVALSIEAAATVASVASWLQIFCHELCIHLFQIKLVFYRYNSQIQIQFNVAPRKPDV